MTRLSLPVSVLSALLLTSSACAQTQSPPAAAPAPPAASTGGPRAIIYRDINFEGPEVILTGTSENLRLQWQIRSIKVESGSWELCAQPNFHPPCRRYDASQRDIPSAVEYTQSARPVG